MIEMNAVHESARQLGESMSVEMFARIAAMEESQRRSALRQLIWAEYGAPPNRAAWRPNVCMHGRRLQARILKARADWARHTTNSSLSCPRRLRCDAPRWFSP
jgi:hypothetical protein